MPVEIELLKNKCKWFGEDLETNLTNWFGTSSDDFLSFMQGKTSATHSSFTGDKENLCKEEWFISPHGSPWVL